MTQRFLELFEYKDGNLYWKQSIGRNKAGNEAGTVIKNGRKYVQVDGKKHLVHRVIWIMHYKDCPEYLDHIDGNPLNNSIENLRPATKQQNAMNRKIMSNNKTGVKGIYLAGKKYVAMICIAGKNTYLGRFSDKKDAALAYQKAAEENFKEFAKC